MSAGATESATPRAHGHGPGGRDRSHELRRAGQRSLAVSLALIVAYMAAEVVAGLVSGSLALLADAGHMLADGASIALALAAMHFAKRPATMKQTFGFHRMEILATLANALTLWLVAGWVVYEGVGRLSSPPEVQGGLVLAVGSVGLALNLLVARILHSSARHSVNVEGAFQHVIADLLGSAGVVVSGVLVWAFGWTLADPILSIAIGALVLASAWRLLAKVVHVLLEGTPKHIDIYELCRRITGLEGVTLIHDVHVWTLSPGYDALTAHVLIEPDRGDGDDLLQRIRAIAADDFGIAHTTIQLDRSLDNCPEDHLDHLLVHAEELAGPPGRR